MSSTCDPRRLYGPLPQTNFLGCSVLSFVMSQGWNEQASELTVELVQDPCISQKIYWDNNLQRQVVSRADPGFKYPDPGCPVYFRIEANPDGNTPLERSGIEYSGIISNWTEKRDSAGNPVFTVKIMDPRDVLGNTQLIMNKYVGSTLGIFNLINVQGFVESFGQSCTSSPAGGLSNFVSDQGVLWSNVKCAIHTLTSTVNRVNIPAAYQQYCARNRLVYVGPKNILNTNTPDSGEGLFPADDSLQGLNISEYLVDISEIPLSSDYYRIAGPNISLLELISQVCQDAGCDYYVELLPVIVSGNIFKIIKIRTTLRTSQPPMGIVQTFINTKKQENVFMAGTVGEELRNEPTSTFLTGGLVQYPEIVRTTYNTTSIPSCPSMENLGATIFPYYGLDTYGSLIRVKYNQKVIQQLKPDVNPNNPDIPILVPDPTKTRSIPELLVYMDFSELNQTLEYPITDTLVDPITSQQVTVPYGWVSESELRAALDSFDTWRYMAYAKELALYEYFNTIQINYGENIKAFMNFAGLKDKDLKGAQFAPRAKIAVGLPENEQIDILNTIFNYIRNFANTYHGRQFLAKVDGVCYSLDVENNIYRFSKKPSTNGCWVNDSVNTIPNFNTSGNISLLHNSPMTDVFRDDQGKYSTILLYANSGLDINGRESYLIDLSETNKELFVTSSDPIYATGTGIDPSGNTWIKASVEPEWITGNPVCPQSPNFYAILTIENPVFSQDNTEMDHIHGALQYLAESKGIDLSQTLRENTNVLIQSNSRGIVQLQQAPPILMPSGAFVPIEDQTTVYGPWGVAGLPGSVFYESDESLVPWEYASDNLMFLSANDKVAGSVSQFRKTERGSVQLAGFPELPLGSEIMALDNANPPLALTTQKFVETRQVTQGSCDPLGNLFTCLIPMGVWSGIYGPSITQINVNIGSQGFTTDYQFNTYSPQFGRFKKSNAEKLKKSGQDRINLRKQITTSLKNSKISSDKITSLKEYKNKRSGSSLLPQTPHHLLIGNNYVDLTSYNNLLASGDPRQRSSVFTEAYKYFEYGMDSEDTYSKTAFMSWDGLIRPVSKTGSGGLPGYVRGSPTGSPNKDNLDPFKSGHDIQVVSFGQNPPQDGSIDILRNGGYESGNLDDYRFMALRGPLVIAGWGYDTEGKPVPSVADSGAVSGIFEGSGSGDFLSGYLSDARTWPVAPVDMRFDRKRKVWVAGGGGSGESCENGIFVPVITGINITSDAFEFFTIEIPVCEVGETGMIRWEFYECDENGGEGSGEDEEVEL
jgi:hypothetical protein